MGVRSHWPVGNAPTPAVSRTHARQRVARQAEDSLRDLVAHDLRGASRDRAAPRGEQHDRGRGAFAVERGTVLGHEARAQRCELLGRLGPQQLRDVPFRAAFAARDGARRRAQVEQARDALRRDQRADLARDAEVVRRVLLPQAERRGAGRSAAAHAAADRDALVAERRARDVQRFTGPDIAVRTTRCRRTPLKWGGWSPA
jgi:hypothetical protein